ncbi:MAG: hypothetical protein NTW21_18445 [Verrucomicrobia bacterium]|nr:hypothetical protein [Verrucomicrobiota bacterium]
MKLPLSASPAIHEGGLRGWLKPNSNFDYDCMEALFGGLGEMADALGKSEEAAKWRAVLAGLGELAGPWIRRPTASCSPPAKT